MSLSKKRRAFTLAETLVALGLIGVLCVTMLSVNSMTDNNYKIASTKLAQVDSALKSWGKAISKSNETGLGTIQTIKDQETLESSLSEYLNHQNLNSSNGQLTVKNEKTGVDKNYDGYSEMTLDNGVTLKVHYVTDDEQTNANGNQYDRSEYDSLLAVVRAEVDVKGKDNVLDEQYVLTSTGVKSVDALYDGWKKYQNTGEKVLDENGNDTGNVIFRADDGSEIISSPEETTIYENVNEVVACENGQTGTIVSSTIGTAMGTYNNVNNTCCPAPKVFKERVGDVNVCTCPDNFTVANGYIRDNNSANCQTIVAAGAYAINGERVLCGHTVKDNTKADNAAVKLGYYCPNDGMTEPVKCPVGYYCPNATVADKETNKYHNDVFYKDNKNKDKVYTGGLIDKIKCPAGKICDAEGLTAPKDCPVGSYCPAGQDPVKCPAGTYYKAPESGVLPTDASVVCKECPSGTYTDTAGQTSCKTCDISKGQFAKAGAKGCSVCPAGQFIKQVNGVYTCASCPAGTFKVTSGVDNVCQPCGANTYQPATGQTACISCPAHSKWKEGETNRDLTSVAACKCDAGYGTDENGTNLNGSNACKLCTKGHFCQNDGDNKMHSCAAGTYQDEVGTTECKICTENHYCPNTTMIEPSPCPNHSLSVAGSDGVDDCKCESGYGTDANGTNQDEAGQYRCKIVQVGHYSPTLNNKIYACEAGTYQDTQGQTDCKLCDVGKYQDQQGQSSCKSCGCGHYNPLQGQVACQSCPNGTYYPESKLPGLPAIEKIDCMLPDDGYYVPEGEGQCEQKLICPAYTKFHVLRQSSINISHKCSIQLFVTGKAGTWTSEWGTGEGYENSNRYSTNGCFNAQRAIPQELKDIVDKLPAADKARTFDINTGHFAYVIAEKADGSAEIAGMFSQRAWCMMATDDNDAYSNCAKFRNNSYNTCEIRCNTGNDTVKQECIESCQHFSYVPSKGSMFASCKNISPWAECKEECSGGKLLYDENCDYEVGVSVFRDASPLILDLKNDGYKFTSVKDGVYFDLNGDGEKDGTAWTDYQTEFDDAFLVYDKNGDGQVNSGKELFGDQSGAVTGFDELSLYDDNGDKVITKEDEIYSKLLLWVDFNKNGTVDYEECTEDGCDENDYCIEENLCTKEFRTLEQIGVTSISTEYEMHLNEDNKVATDEYGNKIGFVGWFKLLVEEFVDGIKTLVETTRTMIDVFFQMF